MSCAMNWSHWLTALINLLWLKLSREENIGKKYLKAVYCTITCTTVHLVRVNIVLIKICACKRRQGEVEQLCTVRVQLYN